MIVAIAEENAVVVRVALALQIADQRGSRWTFLAQPRQLVVEGMRMLKHAHRPAAEQVGIALVAHAKPPYGHSVDRFLAGFQLISPGYIVGRAGRKNFDLRVMGEVFSDVPRV